jgi:hypothetical protein
VGHDTCSGSFFYNLLSNHCSEIAAGSRAAENLRQVQEKLAEQRVQLVEPPHSPSAPARGPPLSMGRAHSANTELAELSIVHVTKAKQ